MKYIFFVIFGILLYKILNNSDKFSISGKDIGNFCHSGNHDECNDNRGTCENKCLCILNEEIDLYVCEKEEPLFDVPSQEEPLFDVPSPPSRNLHNLRNCAPSLVSNFDRSVNISNEIIQKMEEDMTGSNLLQLRPNNFDKEECRRPLQECIEYTLDYPDIPHIYLARKFYYFIISLFRNGDINNLTFNGTSDLDSIQQLDNKSQKFRKL